MAKQRQGGRSFSVLDVITAYQAGLSAQGGKGGKSISNFDYQIAATAMGMNAGKKAKKKSSLPKAHPQKGKYKRGGKVKRKAK